MGWTQQWKKIRARMAMWFEVFSIDILLRTLFAPWKQIVTVTHTDQALPDKFRAMVDNIISRLVGFSIRSIVMTIGLFVVCGVTIASVAFAMVWPLLPLLPALLIVFGLGGLLT